MSDDSVYRLLEPYIEQAGRCLNERERELVLEQAVYECGDIVSCKTQWELDVALCEEADMRKHEQILERAAQVIADAAARALGEGMDERERTNIHAFLKAFLRLEDPGCIGLDTVRRIIAAGGRGEDDES